MFFFFFICQFKKEICILISVKSCFPKPERKFIFILLQSLITSFYMQLSFFRYKYLHLLFAARINVYVYLQLLTVSLVISNLGKLCFQTAMQQHIVCREVQSLTRKNTISPIQPIPSRKSHQNFQSRLKSNFLFTPISNICFKKFSRLLQRS